MWLTNLKIAILEKDVAALDKLLDNIPDLENAEEIEQAIYLLREATELVHTLRDEAAVNMKKIKKNLSFLKSTDTSPTSKFNLKS